MKKNTRDVQNKTKKNKNVQSNGNRVYRCWCLGFFSRQHSRLQHIFIVYVYTEVALNFNL